MDRWVTAASSLLAILLYYNTLNAGFVYDDRRAILSNPDVIGHTPINALFENDFWGTPLTDPGSHGSYRPLCVATYRLNYVFSGFKPWSYHFFNILLHSIATVLVVTTARRLLPTHCRRVGTAVAGLSFAAHPIHTEAVAGVVGRADLAACNLFLLSFLLYTEHVRLRIENQKRICRHNIKSTLMRHQLTTSNQNFRLSCHGLVQQLMINVRRLLKAGKAGPLRILNACEVGTDSVKLKKCQCNGSVSEDSGELLQWCTLAGTLIFAVAATLCKEPAIMIVPLCIFYDVLKDTRQEESYLKISINVVGRINRSLPHGTLLRLRVVIVTTVEHQNSTRPDENSKRPDENSTRPDENSTRPDENSTRPDENSTRPDENSTRPDENSTRPDENSTRTYE